MSLRGEDTLSSEEKATESSKKIELVCHGRHVPEMAAQLWPSQTSQDMPDQIDD